jgi:hypothetical protein
MACSDGTCGKRLVRSSRHDNLVLAVAVVMSMAGAALTVFSSTSARAADPTTDAIKKRVLDEKDKAKQDAEKKLKDMSGGGHGGHGGQAGKAGAPPAGEGMDPMMAAMMEAGTPGQEHKGLEYYIGTWDTTNKFWMAPGTEPMTATGVSEWRWVLDGRWVEGVYQGEMMGTKFEGRSMIGYDKVKKKYVSTWTDSMSTSLMVMEGDWSDKSQTWTFAGDMPNPLQPAKPIPARWVGKIDSPNQYTFSMFEMRDGKEFKSGELVYKRRAAKP